jgi:hypothetical protein
MNEENKLILKCLSILLSDPDGNNGQIRVMLMEEITNLLYPKQEPTVADQTEGLFDVGQEQSE